MEAEGDRLEWQLISEMGEHLVTWVNWVRQFVAEARPLERTAPDEAVRRYRQALEALRAYESITRERGLIAELRGGVPSG